MVADTEGTTITELATELRVPTSSASRCVTALSASHWIKGKAGLGLVDAAKVGRTKRVYLTPKGRALIVRMVAALEE